MTRSTIAGGAVVAVVTLLVVALVVLSPEVEQVAGPATAAAPPGGRVAAVAAGPAGEAPRDVIYGRVTGVDGATYEGRLRWGRDQEAFWGDYFNGDKADNPWAIHAPRDNSGLEVFGIRIGDGGPSFGRQFMARFGDIARIDLDGGDARVTLKSGTMFALDGNSAGDIDDGLRVWDGRHGVTDLDGGEIRTIEFLAPAGQAAESDRLNGTVRTAHGDFTGFITWNQQDGVAGDTLDGRAAGAEVRLRYDTIRAIERQSPGSALVTLLDGREVVLSEAREVGDNHRGSYVDDPRYGRVLVGWRAFERVEFSPAGTAPAYGDFPPGRPLTGIVTTRDGRRLAGRLVYDFDESETTETFDVPLQGVDYNIPFSLIASIVPAGREGSGVPYARVTLSRGAELQLPPTGDLSGRNAGLLIFVDGRKRPEHVPWADVQQIDFTAP